VRRRTDYLSNEGMLGHMTESSEQDGQYALAAKAFGAGLDRLSKAYEADPDIRRDLLQEMHIALWRSLAGFDERCSLRTWTYRVAHNIGASHIVKQRAHLSGLTTLESLDLPATDPTPEDAVGARHAQRRMMDILQRLKPPDRQVMLLYLEDFDASAIAEVTGLSPGAVATRIYRVKALPTAAFEGANPNV
jgi:RNA polymerase sigma-70 factor (ECF subfamily)